MSDLLFPIFLLPWDLADLYMDSQWLVISGPLGQALCKLVSFLTDVSSLVSIQSLVLIAVERFGAVVFPLRSPLISSKLKLCPFFILATWIFALAVYSPYLVAFKLVEEDNGKQYCYIADWNEVFGLSSSFANYLIALNVVFFIPPSPYWSYFTPSSSSNSSHRRFQVSSRSTLSNNATKGIETC